MSILRGFAVHADHPAAECGTKGGTSPEGCHYWLSQSRLQEEVDSHKGHE